MKRYRFYIGIDPGVHTGVCVWDRDERKIVSIQSMKIHRAFHVIWKYNDQHRNNFIVRIEDARKRYWFKQSGSEVWQGAGSIKRDCGIWEDFLIDMSIPFEMVAPKQNISKTTQSVFATITGYHGQTNQHERDATMIVFGM